MNRSQSTDTLILGDLSGLQNFLFDVASSGSGQARRLRSRSLFISLLSECVALRLVETAKWSQKHMIFSAAGKFLLAGPAFDDATCALVRKTVCELSQWLFNETGAGLRLTVEITEPNQDKTLIQTYELAQKALQRAKCQQWGTLLIESGQWQSERLVLPSLSPPCDLCRSRTGHHAKTNDDGQNVLLCDPCIRDWEWGRLLPNANWLELYQKPVPNTYKIAGFDVCLSSEPSPSQEASFVFALAEQHSVNDTRIISKRLARHVPQYSDGQPIEFKDIAAKAEGISLLGVLKMDVDNLGAAFQSVMQNASNFDGLRNLSGRLEDFFARQVDQMLNQVPWNSLYMIYSGGDDLLLAGPWNVTFNFAGEVQKAFKQTFSAERFTLSAGLALIKPTFPIRLAADQADSSLDQAKHHCSEGATTPKDQCAAFGQIWKWSDHEYIINTAHQLAEWVRQDVMPRGWLHTLLELAETQNRHPKLPVTAQLAYHIGRNYPLESAPGLKGELGHWAKTLLEDFDVRKRPETRLLPAILRHTLTATRSIPT